MYADRLTYPFGRYVREERERKKSLAVINKEVSAREKEEEKEWCECVRM